MTIKITELSKIQTEIEEELINLGMGGTVDHLRGECPMPFMREFYFQDLYVTVELNDGTENEFTEKEILKIEELLESHFKIWDDIIILIWKKLEEEDSICSSFRSRKRFWNRYTFQDGYIIEIEEHMAGQIIIK
tara:strand:+ start:1129 stop:1530 length:402 start_codon:yes stop_codon:yes gene_type:complete